MNRKSGKLEAHMRIARLEDRLRHLPSERLKYSSRGKGENGLRNVSLSSDGNAPLRRTLKVITLRVFRLSVRFIKLELAAHHVADPCHRKRKRYIS